jgi:hypothetical protein
MGQGWSHRIKLFHRDPEFADAIVERFKELIQVV